ncbi:MAG: hypothetical protein ABFR50_12395, partial [Candidatus Fermentibacteria bacterium]
FDMPVNDDNTKGYTYSNEMTSGIRMRSGLLVLHSSSAVALAFGISFYFALISSQTAVAMQFPELAPIVAKLKSLLVVNTTGFVAVIIVSFWFLSRMLTSKMFISLGIVMTGLRKAAENRYPETSLTSETGPFGEFERVWNTVVQDTRDKESHEIDILEKTLSLLSGPEVVEARASIEKMIDEKKQRICTGSGGRDGAASGGTGTDDALFMQPV